MGKGIGQVVKCGDNMKKKTKKEWLGEQVLCDEWGRPPSLADIPLTVMTRKEALIKQGGDSKSINKLYKDSV
tara:strand:+ start:1791 stop:2006 length:216 start_codon:yes stop_codon:yes gene_type:complete